MSTLKPYQVRSRIRRSGKVYLPDGDPIPLKDADAARLAKLGCIDPVPISMPELVPISMPELVPISMPELVPIIEPVPVLEPVPVEEVVPSAVTDPAPVGKAGKKPVMKGD